jgi:hypothetical protein
MRIIVFSLLSILFATTIGCNNQIEDKRTAQIDSIIDVMEGAHRALTAIDSAHLAKLKEVYDAYVDFYSNEYDDVSNAEFYTNELGDMAICRKRISTTVSSYGQWQRQLEKSILQLKTLRHDYAHGLLDSAEIEQYLYDEAFESATLNKEVTKNVGSASWCFRNHRELSAKLDSARAAFLAQKNND